MKKFIAVCLLLVALVWTYGFLPVGAPEVTKNDENVNESLEKEFVILVYAAEKDAWDGKVIESIAEQNYSSYRVVYINDGANETNIALTRKLVRKYNLSDKFSFIHNRHKEGLLSQIYYFLSSCDNDEVLMVMRTDSALAHKDVFNELNQSYQDSEVKATLCQMVFYPSYEKTGFASRFRASAYPIEAFTVRVKEAKKVPLALYLDNGKFPASDEEERLIYPLLEMIGHNQANIDKALVLKKERPTLDIDYYELFQSVKTLSKEAYFSENQSQVSVVIYSKDSPMELSAELKQLQKMLSETEKITVCYKATTKSFKEGYEKLQETYQDIRLIQCDYRSSFDQSILQAIASSPSDYIIFASDDMLLKQRLDTKELIKFFEDTGAYHLSLSFDPARQIEVEHQFIKSREEHYIYTSNSLEDLTHLQKAQMTLFKKQDLIQGNGKLIRFLLGETKGRLPKRAIVGACLSSAAAIQAKIALIATRESGSVPLYSKEELNERYLNGEEIDPSPISAHSSMRTVEYYPHFVKPSVP